MSTLIKYSPAAVRDLERIWNEVYSASYDYNTTLKYIDGILERSDSKKLFLKSGKPLYYDNSFTGYYYVIYKVYLAFYRIEENDIIVDRILYAKSDCLKRLSIYAESE